MPSEPAPADPGWDEDPAWLDRDPMTAAEREAWLDRLCAQDDDPFDQPEEYWDPESCAPPPGQDELTGQELAGAAEAAADEMLALDAASTGRRRGRLRVPVLLGSVERVVVLLTEPVQPRLPLRRRHRVAVQPGGILLPSGVPRSRYRRHEHIRSAEV